MRIAAKPTERAQRGAAGGILSDREDGEIKLAESGNARGVQTSENRRLDYSAEQLTMHFGENAVIQKIVGERSAKLNSTARTANTWVTSDRLDMDFDDVDKEAQLKLAVATGKGLTTHVTLHACG